MTERNLTIGEGSSLQQNWTLGSLEAGQLTQAKRKRLPRRALRGSQILILWSMRIYVLFMVAVVVYQIWIGAR
jgi:hypothetical protein